MCEEEVTTVGGAGNKEEVVSGEEKEDKANSRIDNNNNTLLVANLSWASLQNPPRAREPRNDFLVCIKPLNMCLPVTLGHSDLDRA